MNFSKLFKQLKDRVEYTFILPSGKRLKGNWYQDHILDLYVRFKYSDCEFDFVNNVITLINEI